MTINFDTNATEMRIITKIAKRAVQMALDADVDYRLLDAEMDITACHCNGTPLKLEALLAADDANFGHDVFGIRRYIDRKTGELTNCFLPRFADTRQAA